MEPPGGKHFPKTGFHRMEVGIWNLTAEDEITNKIRVSTDPKKDGSQEERKFFFLIR